MYPWEDGKDFMYWQCMVYSYVKENVDTDEAKGFFEGNFSHVYFILYDCFVSAEANLRQRGKLRREQYRYQKIYI